MRIFKHLITLVAATWLTTGSPALALTLDDVQNPTICKTDHHRRVKDDVSNEEFRRISLTALAICGAEAPPYTDNFNSFWEKIASICAQGKHPTAMWDRLEFNSFFNNSFLPQYARCDNHIPEIIELFNIPVDANEMLKQRNISINNLNEATNILRENASSGSAHAKFLLAANLLDIESFANKYIPEGADEAIEIYQDLAKQGYQDIIFNMLVEMEKATYASPSHYRDSYIMYMWGGLARSGEPRAYVRTSGYYLDTKELYYAEEQIKEGKKIATGEVLNMLLSMEKEILRIRNAPSAGHIAISGFLAAAGFVGKWEHKGLSAAVDHLKNCNDNKPAVELNPTLRLTYSLLGCFAY